MTFFVPYFDNEMQKVIPEKSGMTQVFWLTLWSYSETAPPMAFTKVGS